LTSGDFSRWLEYKKGDNFNGVLYQQGRVLSDSDGTTQTRLVNDWQHTAGGDIIGRNVAAIPAYLPNSFKVSSATLDVNTQQILVKVEPGRAWVDGMVTYLENGDPEIARLATYLGIPYHDFPPEVSPGSRDAVILEVYPDVINAFQMPDQLLEPALGGPDTTEMLQTTIAFKLLRLSQETCSAIPDILTDRLERGRLTVSLQSNPPIVGECPVDQNFGYTGVTHNLYRIEVAEVNISDPPKQKFKWSQFNGGLVGRGNYSDPTSKSKIRISHNMQAILWSGLTSFYLEIISLDKEAGFWKTLYGTTATLNSENELVLSEFPVLGSADPPDDTDGIFFRLWNGINDINEFTGDSPPAMLVDGIHLKFDPPTTTSNYLPHDYWRFEVRAGGIKNEEVLLDHSLPHGISYHRVPLAIIEWDSSGNFASVKEDCRVIFQPLVEQKVCQGGGCCSISVGDGFSSHGDYDSLQDAINNIEELGGEICILPGVHKTNAIVDGKENLVIRGCGNRTKVVNSDGHLPIITIRNSSRRIVIRDIDFEADQSAGGVIRMHEVIEDIRIQNNRIRSITKPNEPTVNPKLIKGLIEVDEGTDVIICDNDLSLDWETKKHTEAAIYIQGNNISVTKNNVISRNIATIMGVGIRDEGIGGGIQIGSGSNEINIIQNRIIGGSGNGITLGDAVKDPNGNYLPPIYRVTIEDNVISDMDLSGIGVPRLLTITYEFVKKLSPLVQMKICGNSISYCLQHRFDDSMLEEARLTHNGSLLRGFGGIILHTCWELIIEDNVIRHNGEQHIDPICGIFIPSATDVRIIGNYIWNDVPIGGGSGSLKFGSRGGILVIYILYVCMIHGNVIRQPAGPALRINGHSTTVSVVNNYFTSELSDIEADPIYTGGVVSIYATASSISSASGSVIFQCNRSELLQNDGSGSTTSHYIYTDYSLCFGSNHITCWNSNIRRNTFLKAFTIRACENCFEEKNNTNTISLISLSTKMNITSNNQADNCIIVCNKDIPPPPVASGNLVLNNPNRCKEIEGELCSKTMELQRSYE